MGFDIMGQRPCVLHRLILTFSYTETGRLTKDEIFYTCKDEQYVALKERKNNESDADCRKFDNLKQSESN